jgi:hypothetical protein
VVPHLLVLGEAAQPHPRRGRLRDQLRIRGRAVVDHLGLPLQGAVGDHPPEAAQRLLVDGTDVGADHQLLLPVTPDHRDDEVVERHAVHARPLADLRLQGGAVLVHPQPAHLPDPAEQVRTPLVTGPPGRRHSGGW